MILIGSRALNKYVPLKRKLHDWDILASQEEVDKFDQKYSQFLVKKTADNIIYDIRGAVVEFKNPSTLEPSDVELLNSQHDRIVDSGLGRVWIPSIQTLYDIKKATANHIHELKHKHDLNCIKEHFPNLIEDTTLYWLRNNEIKLRIEKSGLVKYEFFHKYHIPEYILHDRLHDLFANLLELKIPTYQRITVAETDISEELFNNLTHGQKISLMVEEVLVLNLERWFIPQMIENGINYRLVDMFYNNNEAMPTYLILKHVCLKGLKGEKEYITNFTKANFFEIEQEWIKAKQKIRNKYGFPNWLFNEIFDLRKRYRNGEKIVIK